MKIIRLRLATILIVASFNANGQSLSIGARFTPNVISPVYVRNPSPSLIYGPKKNALEITNAAGYYTSISNSNDKTTVSKSLNFYFNVWLQRQKQ